MDGQYQLWEMEQSNLRGGPQLQDDLGEAPTGLLIVHNYTLEYAANYVKIKQNKDAAPPDVSRGTIKRFSDKSQSRMRILLNSIEYTSITMITLTYPGEYPTDSETYKYHLRRFRSRLERAYGRVRVIWKLEFQRRGAPHYHLLLLDVGAISREWLSLAWYEIVGSNDERHRQAGTRIERTLTTASEAGKAIVSYCIKYTNKSETKVGESEYTGRFWGCWNVEKNTTKVVGLDGGQILEIVSTIHGVGAFIAPYNRYGYCGIVCYGCSPGNSELARAIDAVQKSAA